MRARAYFLILIGFTALLYLNSASAAPLGRATPNLMGGYTYRDARNRIVGESRAGLGGQTRFYSKGRYEGYIRGPAPKAYLPGIKK